MRWTDIEGIVSGTMRNDSSMEVLGFSTDSNTAKENDLYIPLQGKHHNGNDFLLEAAAKGASFLFIESSYLEKETVLNRLLKEYPNVGILEVESGLEALKQLASYRRERFQGTIIAITGSVGKTTTKELLATVLKEKYQVFKSEKNYNNIIGVSKMILSLKEEEVAIFELGMNHAYEIEEMSQLLKPDLAVITNIGTSHIGNLGSLENICRAKLEIIAGMRQAGVLLLNGEDPLLKEVKVPIKTYFYDTKDVRITKIADQIVLHLQDELFVLSACGDHYIPTAMCVIAIARFFDMNNTMIRKGFAKYQGNEMRMQRVQCGKAIVINDAYNASFESMKNGLSYVDALPVPRKIAILGDMLELGDYTSYYHQELGTFLNQTSITKVYLYGEHMKKLQKTCIKETVVVSSIAELISCLKKETKEESVFYIKGSRKMGLEQVMDAF